MRIITKLAYYYRRGLTYISPKLNTAVVYKFRFGRKLDLNNPITLNEKILWLKFHTYKNNLLVKQCADKYCVREYVEQAGCGDILTDLIGVYKTPQEIEWDKLPNRFAIKLNIGCGYNYFVTNKSDQIKEKLLKK